LVNYALNTIDYFLLFATLGIATLGTREIATYRNDKEQIDTVFSKLVGVNFLFSIFALVALALSIYFLRAFEEIRILLYIGSAKILFSVFAVEWYFTGTENFRYITIRSLAIKICYVALVFICVKSSSDYVLYFILTIGSVVVNSIINFIYSQTCVNMKMGQLFSKTYIGQNLKLGIYFIMSSMYITFNVMYLGIVSTNEQVGFYSTSVKLYFIILSLFSAYTNVMLPRMSSLVANSDKNQYIRRINQSYYLVVNTAIPLIVVSMFMAPGIIEIVSGSGYEASVLPMRILMPAMILVWLSQIIVFQGLIPLKKDKVLLITSFIGASSSILLNLLLTKKLGAMGSAIILVSCEVLVTSFYFYTIRRLNIIPLPRIKGIVEGLVRSIPYIIVCVLTLWFLDSHVLQTVVAGGVSVFVFGLVFKLKILPGLRKI
jgi:O-antigen/teichoic acid export membrane protein